MSLSVKNLFKRYGNDWVWKDVSFETDSGEVFGIFGPNSSGKTTLLKVIAGIEESNGGTVYSEDRDVTKSGSAERNFHFPTAQNRNGWRSIFGSNKTPENNQSNALEKA